jgi:hypothetical protein
MASRMHFNNGRSNWNGAYARMETTSRVAVVSRHKVSFSSDGRTSLGNYGWLFVQLENTHAYSQAISYYGYVFFLKIPFFISIIVCLYITPYILVNWYQPAVSIFKVTLKWTKH